MTTHDQHTPLRESDPSQPTDREAPSVRDELQPNIGGAVSIIQIG